MLPAPPAARPPAAAQIETVGTGRPIQGVAFRGVKAPAEVADAAQRFIGRPATRETLVELAAALSSAYERTDVALYSVAIPEQDFEKDVVIVVLTEGWIEDVQISAQPGEFSLLEARARKLIGHSPLGRGLYERQISLMSSIPGVTIDTTLGNEDGDDAIQLLVQPTRKRAEVSVGLNNRGPSLVGDLVTNAGVNFYRLLTDGDQLSVIGAATPELKRYKQVSASYALPIGADGLSLTGSGSWLQTRPKNLDLRGTAKLAAITLGYPVLRRFKHAADLSLSLDGVDSHNALFGNVIASENTRAARFAGSYASSGEKHNLAAGATLSHGLDIFGARVDRLLVDASFKKASGTASYERIFTEGFLGRVSASAQYSSDRLPAAELFSVGGPAIGRAFDTGFLTGDSGAGGFAELAYRPASAAAFRSSELYLFADAATVEINRRSIFPKRRFDLASAGAGARLQFRNLMLLGLEAAAVVDRPHAGYDQDWRISFYYSLAL